jgi:NAD(P)-dependent dehydrogenase (short-subunit alcohol dehydrogenase family)
MRIELGNVRVHQGSAGPTVLIAGAGCATGLDLAAILAAKGASVIAVERSDARALALGRLYPARIETLTLDVFNPLPCRRLGAIWAETPVDLLLHLHLLREPARPGAAVAAIPALTRALWPGLARGAGEVLILACVPEAGAAPEAHAYDAALRALVPLMQVEARARARLNLLRARRAEARAAFRDVVAGWPGAVAPLGSVLDLGRDGAGD